MAAVWRKTCGETALERSDGHMWAAVWVCRAARSATASRLRDRPVPVGNSAAVGPAATLVHPGAEHTNCFGSQWRAAFLAAFPVASNVGAGAQVDVLVGQRGELRNPEAGLHGKE
jgi:hypothetical protein